MSKLKNDAAAMLVKEAIRCYQLSPLKRLLEILEYVVTTNWRQPLDMFGFVSLIEYRNRQLRNGKYETIWKNWFKIGLKPDWNRRNIKEITTQNTPMGLWRWYRLPFGIKTASYIFQRAIEKILLGKVDNIIIYQDDICLGARTREE